MKQAAFVLGIVGTTIAVFSALAVAWLYIEKKVKYITTEDNIEKKSKSLLILALYGGDFNSKRKYEGNQAPHKIGRLDEADYEGYAACCIE